MNTNILKFSIISILFFISILVFTISCQNKNESIIEIKKSVKQLNDSKISGYISLTSKNINNKSSVELEAHLFGLKPGESAIHIHEFADCSSIDGLSLGGHWNPTSQPHGKWGNEEGFHLGDIGNFSVDSIGHGMVKFKTDLWCINCSDKDKDLIGRSIVIHNGSDDYISQPSGAAGIRIGCMDISSDNIESN
ncbi:MAG: superoxide dismutase family protein [Flavobacteriales bacterium]|jgi:Cu-Zn family superoxide dismutase|nr:MAG: superoxide dismutase family protein [Flavobacteriales bacterium]|tara:strand:+ start:958 stop:1536 length:579 start_codon:yes stop_codon:yes gene_type:complete